MKCVVAEVSLPGSMAITMKKNGKTMKGLAEGCRPIPMVIAMTESGKAVKYSAEWS